MAHLCEPRRPVLHGRLPSLFGRLRDNPSVTDAVPGFTEYCRAVAAKNSAYRLTRVSLYTNDTTHPGQPIAPWRIRGYSPEIQDAMDRERAASDLQRDIERAQIAAWRARIVERDQLIRSLFGFDKEEAKRVDALNRRAERARVRSAVLSERAKLLADRKRERDARRSLRKGDRERSALSRLPRQALFYPYLVHEPATDAEHMLIAVHQAVPKGLPDYLREDICQDLLMALLAGEILIDDLHDEAPAFISKVKKMHPLKYGDLSLDAMVGDETDTTFGDLYRPQSYSRMEF